MPAFRRNSLSPMTSTRRPEDEGDSNMNFTRKVLPRFFLPLALLWVLGSAVAACGSSGANTFPDPTLEATTAASLAVSTTTVTAAEARSGFVTDVAAATPVLDSLTDADLGCVADRLLVDLEPAEVVTLTRNGPRPDQARLTVSALRQCELVIRLVALGMEQAIAEDSLIPQMDVHCLLDGLTDEDLVPVLEARFASGSVDLGDREVDNLLADTPIMANALRCMVTSEMGGDAESSPVCAGLADRLGDMMTTLLVVETESAEELDPLDLLVMFQMTDEIFAWLIDEVPKELRVDAILVHHTSRRIVELMAETLQTTVDEEAEGDGGARLTALLGAMTRIEAELSRNWDEVDAANDRLQDWAFSTCGETSSMLFDLLAGTGPST